jgi:hypothetical protein
VWDESKERIAFVGLNPSTADEVKNDPTVTRCINYAQRWGYGGMWMLNLFAYRATDPNIMKAQADPVGPENDRSILEVYSQARLSIACWGTHGAHRDRGRQVIAQLPALHCLGITKAGYPKHPLYLHRDLVPVLFRNVG